MKTEKRLPFDLHSHASFHALLQGRANQSPSLSTVLESFRKNLLKLETTEEQNG